MRDKKTESGERQQRAPLDETYEDRTLDELSDEELVTAHLNGRPGAFQELYDRYRDRLIHFVIRKTGDP
ncbi:MAG: hypothetical protein GWM92_16970, partial [Gemmatimonadetes bacterium]|nr:hypothetical protein [Gemmatimonadota bacterium]NIR80462.1 hypothetical protein [Gemmatimonadota bacterium]NIT89223.1 hypothetical protein [Gemmatimonadota bacterium]NIU33022.1 hypothetical protein [Gemmatimonadota bacterium]NIU37406.1 hypothetical protein [Gemmatimonadota bacterium]